MSNRFWQKPRRITAGLVAGAVVSLAALAASPAGATQTNYGPNGDGDVLVRYWGSTRYETSIALAQATFGTTSPPGNGSCNGNNVFLASGDNFPDALTAASLTKSATRSIVLVPASGSLPASTKAFLATCSGATIIGGPAAVSAAIQTEVGGVVLGGAAAVSRIGGIDRFDTGRLVAQQAYANNGGTIGYAPDLVTSTNPPLPTVIVATGLNFPDALAAGPLASRGVNNGPTHPIILTGTTSLPSASVLALFATGAKQAIVLGNATAVASSVFTQLASIGVQAVRVGGADRFGTAAALAATLMALGQTGPSTTTMAGMGITDFSNFPDALTAGPFLGQDCGQDSNNNAQSGWLCPIYGVLPGSVPAVTQVALTSVASFAGNTFLSQNLYAIGGPAAVSDPTAFAAFTAINTKAGAATTSTAINAVAKVTPATQATTGTGITAGTTLVLTAKNTGAGAGVKGNAWAAQIISPVIGQVNPVDVQVNPVTKVVSILFSSAFVTTTTGASLAATLNALPAFSANFSAAGGAAAFGVPTPQVVGFAGGTTGVVLTTTFDKTITAVAATGGFHYTAATGGTQQNSAANAIGTPATTVTSSYELTGAGGGANIPVVGSLVQVDAGTVTPANTAGTLLVSAVS